MTKSTNKNQLTAKEVSRTPQVVPEGETKKKHAKIGDPGEIFRGSASQNPENLEPISRSKTPGELLSDGFSWSSVYLSPTLTYLVLHWDRVLVPSQLFVVEFH